MKWIFASERLPNVKGSVFIRSIHTKAGGMILNSELSVMDNLQNIQWLDESESEGSDGWVSVEEKPLTEDMGNGRWICTDAGDSEFIAAVPYRDKKQPGKELWWIRHCVISNGDLCVVTDDDVEPSGWEIDSVTHYRPLPAPPKQSTE